MEEYTIKTKNGTPKNIAQRVEEFARPVVEELGCVLWDVEFEKVGSVYELCIYIDLDDRTVDVSDCEKVSRAMDPLLDQYDPIEESYTFYVSSAGLERTLKKPWQYEKFIGSMVEIKLYQPLDGQKSICGILKAYNDGDITLTLPNDTEQSIKSNDAALCRLKVEF